MMIQPLNQLFYVSNCIVIDPGELIIFSLACRWSSLIVWICLIPISAKGSWPSSIGKLTYALTLYWSHSSRSISSGHPLNLLFNLTVEKSIQYQLFYPKVSTNHLDRRIGWNFGQRNHILSVWCRPYHLRISRLCRRFAACIYLLRFLSTPSDSWAIPIYLLSIHHKFTNVPGSRIYLRDCWRRYWKHFCFALKIRYGRSFWRILSHACYQPEGFPVGQRSSLLWATVRPSRIICSPVWSVPRSYLLIFEHAPLWLSSSSSLHSLTLWLTSLKLIFLTYQAWWAFDQHFSSIEWSYYWTCCSNPSAIRGFSQAIYWFLVYCLLDFPFQL